MSLRILILHSRYRSYGGEDAVVEEEARALSAAGHEVHLEIDPGVLKTAPVDLARLALKTPYDRSREAWTRELLRKTKADLIHAHNFFPSLTPAVHTAAALEGVAVVQTLHNYRLICAAGHLTRDGKSCEKCVHGTNAWAIFHRCYHRSIVGSAAVAAMQWRANSLTWHRHVDRFIALTELARGQFIAAGLPADIICVKPNFVADHPAPALDVGARQGFVYAGRLSPEKGVDVLLGAWRHLPGVPLTILGEGPERATLERSASSDVCFLGHRTRDEVRRLVAGSRALVVPSVWNEGFPVVIAEAFATGTPVIASRIGALPQIVIDGLNGATFRAGDENHLAQTVTELNGSNDLRARLSAGARQAYERYYSPSTSIGMLGEIYEQAIVRRRSLRLPLR